jgi:hypothetical protein
MSKPYGHDALGQDAVNFSSGVVLVHEHSLANSELFCSIFVGIVPTEH